MKKTIRRGGGFLLILLMVFTAFPAFASADAIEGDENYVPYLSLGADLKENERKTVLELLDITEEDVEGFDVIEVTNADEHKYLGDYLDASIIGSRALSSVLVVKQEEGFGIEVETSNITYCTEGMYRNALITAGVQDAKVAVAGPFSITGTAALVGAMQAYGVMTGEEITEEAMDAAINELVVTSNIADDIGDSGKVEELMALVKQQIAERGLKSAEDIKEAVAESAKALNIQLTDEQTATVMSLMGKVSKLDLDIDALKEQARDLYDKIKNLDVDTEGIASGIGGFFKRLFQSIGDFFSNLFG